MILGRNDKEKPPHERREHKRYDRHFILTYYAEGHPETKEEVTQLKNISKGGMCFVASRSVPENSYIEIEMETPYLTEKTVLRGKVLQCHEEVKGLIFFTRVQFEHLRHDSEFILEKLIQYFTHGENTSNE